MFNSGILDVAIGLFFIFLILSLICSAINELIGALLKKRARDLEKWVRVFLHDEHGTGLVKKIYEHPLIFGLFKGGYDPRKKWNWRLPSYIPPRDFALALMDIVMPADQTTSPSAADTTIKPASGWPDWLSPTPQKDLRRAILENPEIVSNRKVQQALLALVDAAGNDLNKARENIERWFNSAMERLSGRYKRWSQVFVLVLGLALAVAVNVDTITIARSLSYDAAIRNSLVAAAQEYAKAPRDTGKVTLPPETRVKNNLEIIQKHGLPIGWDLGKEGNVPESRTGWFLKVIGWFMTATAISLGAPFWFDLLNKFMTARSTLKPAKPAASQKA